MHPRSGPETCKASSADIQPRQRQNMKRPLPASSLIIACLLAAMCGLASASEDPRLEYSRARLKPGGETSGRVQAG